MSLFLANIASLSAGDPTPPGGHTFLDADAETFSDAIGTLTTGQQEAIDDLVIELKAASVWTKCNAIYPFIGGTASAHKFNLKDPQDTNGAFRLTYTGSITHNSNGMTCDGTASFADSNLNANTVLTTNDTHLAIYSRTTAQTGGEMGCFSSDLSRRFRINCRIASNTFSCNMNNSTATIGFASVAETDGRGFFMAGRTSSTSLTLYKNGSSVATATGTHSTALPNTSIGVGGILTEGVGYDSGSSKNIAFASIGAGLTSGEASAYSTAVTAFQTALSRNV